ncbi:hypothetical protein Cob_v006373 [Colletotrichum orbiculare MAFF 240422]|uniref:Uncharacterized protein n=1 Tax=Colletotrichum orbiculare (strain 104-T / ATCC 96160 / CBS 514.97 / LARS 414 / MAFF 240422) TaxID=1213857 RepID=N4V5W5_COLOR|nr:hypothetical protein Cob_v006373 [Colletotrichum orbiculare MAFF 240422]
MFSSTILTLFIFGVANAAPFFDARSLNSTKWTPGHVLQPHEVIIYGEDKRMEVIHRQAYDEMIKSMDVLSSKPDENDAEFFNVEHFNHTEHHDHHNETASSSVDRRDCGTSYSMTTDKTFDFIDWDVQMSPVVTADITSMDINVMRGYTVTNSVQVSAGLDVTWIKDKLKNTLGINYSRQWATQTTINIKGTVSPGYSGCMITKPFKTRRTGRAFSGCPGSIKQTGTWQADSYKEGSYDGISWVSGSIMICQKKGSIPLSRCEGSGNFI